MPIVETEQRRGDLMAVLGSITFFEVAMTLLFIGCAERLLLGYAPASMVGRNGWLLRADIDD